MKYLFIQIKERNGEQEYIQPLVREIKDNEQPNDVAKEIAKTWYDDDNSCEIFGEGTSCFETYEFFGGCIITKVSSYREITKEEYNVLKRFI